MKMSPTVKHGGGPVMLGACVAVSCMCLVPMLVVEGGRD